MHITIQILINLLVLKLVKYWHLALADSTSTGVQRVIDYYIIL